MKYKAIIFDMDGTIIDTEHLWKKTSLCLLERRGIILNPDEAQELYKELHGIGMKEACLYLKMKGGLKEDVYNLMEEKHIIAHDLFEKEVQFMRGFLDFFNQVKQQDIKTAIATNATSLTVDVTNKALNLEKLFGTHVYHLDHVNGQSKPHPAIYLHAAQNINIDPEHCIAIEDSARGIQAAKKAGMKCIGFNSGNDKNLLSQADLIVDTYDEIDLKKLLKP